jgi:hypothetical protein
MPLGEQHTTLCVHRCTLDSAGADIDSENPDRRLSPQTGKSMGMPRHMRELWLRDSG